MPVVISGKVVCVVAVTAFVGAFRLHAGSDGNPDAAASTMTDAHAAALRADATTTRAAAGVQAVPALGAIAALPALHSLHPARPHVAAKHPARKHHAAKKHHVAKKHHAARQVAPQAPVKPAATAVPTPVPTAVPRTPVYRAPVAKPKSYVGKSFDSKG